MWCKAVSALFIHVARRWKPDSDVLSRPLIHLTDKSRRPRGDWAKLMRKLDSNLPFTARWEWKAREWGGLRSIINEYQTDVGSHPALGVSQLL